MLDAHLDLNVAWEEEAEDVLDNENNTHQDRTPHEGNHVGIGLGNCWQKTGETKQLVSKMISLKCQRLFN